MAVSRSNSSASPAPLTALTPRELAVIEHVATGADNAQIAGRLTLSEATVKTISTGP